MKLFWSTFLNTVMNCILRHDWLVTHTLGYSKTLRDICDVTLDTWGWAYIDSVRTTLTCNMYRSSRLTLTGHMGPMHAYVCITVI